jgi:sulfatase maturation enzyme AslB (radical SAM superfamily)
MSDEKIDKNNLPHCTRSIVGIQADNDKSYEWFKDLFKKEHPVLNKEDKEIFEKIKLNIVNTNSLPFDLMLQEKRFLDKNKHDSEKCVKYAIHRYKLKIFPKSCITASFPSYILIEPFSACNLRCIMCFQIDKTFTKKPYMGGMSLELFKKIIDEAVEGGTKAITMASRGEPTMNKNLPQMLEYTKDKFFEVKINTNGTRLTEKLCHTILRTGVTELVFSIDAENKELYEKIRVRGEFDKVIENIKMFNKIRGDYYKDSPIITTASGVFFDEQQNIEKYTSFFHDLVDQTAVIALENRWNTYANDLRPEDTKPCEYLWQRMYIWFDGKCNPCDVDYKSYLETGNINNNSIRDIWNGLVYQKLRKDHENKKRGDYVPCDRCGVV